MSHDVTYKLANFLISRKDVQKKFRPKKFITTKRNFFFQRSSNNNVSSSEHNIKGAMSAGEHAL